MTEPPVTSSVVDPDSTGEWSSVDRQAVAPVPPRRRRVLPPLVVGVVGYASLFAFGATRSRSTIERKLRARTEAALQGAGSGDAVVRYRGRDATVVVPSGADTATIESLVKTNRNSPEGVHIAGPRVVVVRTDPTRQSAATTTVPPVTGTVHAMFSAEQAVVVSGSVGSEEAHAALIAGIRQQSPVVEISDTVEVKAGGIDARTATWVGRTIGELKRVGALNGDVKGSASGLAITGAVPNLAVRDALGAFADASGVTVTHSLTIERAPDPTLPGPDLFGDTPAPPDDLQHQIDALLADGVVQFKPDSADLRADAERVIDDLAALLKQSPGLRIEVVGHTDSNGDPQHNLALSKHRAEAVRDRLAKQGINAERMTTRGEGDQQPLVPNDTPANRRLNRRIQVIVQPQTPSP